MSAVRAVALAAAILISAGVSPAQRTRAVEGVVTDQDGRPLAGAVVKLENTLNYQIRSFITRDDGKYRFNGLRQDVSYELRPQYSGASGSSKRLSKFDSRERAIINLEVRTAK